jgi:hypothetical protein
VQKHGYRRADLRRLLLVPEFRAVKMSLRSILRAPLRGEQGGIDQFKLFGCHHLPRAWMNIEIAKLVILVDPNLDYQDYLIR